LSNIGHEVVIVDNLSRRNIDNETETNSLMPIAPRSTHLKAWKELTGKANESQIFNIAAKYKGRCERRKRPSTSLWRVQY
jgi:UDP-sulfoquinovose synthase